MVQALYLGIGSVLCLSILLTVVYFVFFTESDKDKCLNDENAWKNDSCITEATCTDQGNRWKTNTITTGLDESFCYTPQEYCEQDAVGNTYVGLRCISKAENDCTEKWHDNKCISDANYNCLTSATSQDDIWVDDKCISLETYCALDADNIWDSENKKCLSSNQDKCVYDKNKWYKDGDSSYACYTPVEHCALFKKVWSEGASMCLNEIEISVRGRWGEGKYGKISCYTSEGGDEWTMSETINRSLNADLFTRKYKLPKAATKFIIRTADLTGDTDIMLEGLKLNGIDIRGEVEKVPNDIAGVQSKILEVKTGKLRWDGDYYYPIDPIGSPY